MKKMAVIVKNIAVIVRSMALTIKRKPPQEALKRLKDLPEQIWPTHIFVDINMSKMVGFQFIKTYISLDSYTRKTVYSTMKNVDQNKSYNFILDKLDQYTHSHSFDECVFSKKRELVEVSVYLKTIIQEEVEKKMCF